MTAPERADCPHCDPEHRDPTSRPWNVRVGPERDADGQPVYLYALPANGAHVAESDAEWLWQLIRDAQSSEPTPTFTREQFADELEAPGSPLCDCVQWDSTPTNPMTGAVMAHHCLCQAVTAAKTIRRGESLTLHARECVPPCAPHQEDEATA